MRVVNAGVVVELVAGDLDAQLLGSDQLAVPHLIDREVPNVLRRLVAHGHLTEKQGRDALDGFGHLTMTRFPATSLRSRIWELRHNLTAYDATYVALAEMLDADALLTTDARLAAAPGIRCQVQVI